MSYDPFSDSIALQRAKNSFYGNFGNPMPSTPAPDPNNTLTGNAGLPQKAPETDEAPPVQAQQDMVPVNKSQIPQNLPADPGYQNPYKSQLEETEKLAPQYEEPSKGRKRVGNVLKVIGGLASIGAGPTVGGLINQGADYIEHEPYNKKVRAFSTDLQNQQRLADTDQKVTGGEATVNHLNAQAEAEKARRIAEEERGKALGKMADFKTNQENFKAKLTNDLAKANAKHNDTFQYTDESGKQGTAFVNMSDPSNPSLTDAGTHLPVENYTGLVPINKTLESRRGTGSITSQLATEDQIAHPEHTRTDSLKQGLVDTGNDPNTKRQLAASQLEANKALVQNRHEEGAKLNSEVQDINAIHGNVPPGAHAPQTPGTPAPYVPKNALKALHYSGALENPEMLNDIDKFGKNPAMQQDAQQRFQEITGLTSPNKGVDTRALEVQRAALSSVSAANRIATKLKNNPPLAQAVGAWNGRVSNIEQALGAASNANPKLTKEIQSLSTDFALMKLAESRIASGTGRGTNQIMQQLTDVSPQMKFDVQRSLGAIDSIKANAARTIDSIESEKYGPGKSMFTKVGDERIPTYKVGNGKVYKLNPEKVQSGDRKNAYEYYTTLEK